MKLLVISVSVLLSQGHCVFQSLEIQGNFLCPYTLNNMMKAINCWNGVLGKANDAVINNQNIECHEGISRSYEMVMLFDLVITILQVRLPTERAINLLGLSLSAMGTDLLLVALY